jgi:bifunctional DNA-binding transcriptional regulator/antitoxin component of YhaV-PrlF toxin-antitoxin module
MVKLTVTAAGKVTFPKEVLQHLGVKPGETIELKLRPDGRGLLKAGRPQGTVDGFIGLLAGRRKKVATIEEINEATQQSWASEKIKGTVDTNVLVPSVVCTISSG